jgi:hypothetical protein
MADNFPGLHQGAFEGSEVFNFIADEAITVGSPVIFVAGSGNEKKPRVEPHNVITVKAAGVCVGGDNDGVYGGSGSDGQAASAAGQTVTVCTSGICKVQIGAAVAINAPLSLSTTDGKAITAASTSQVFGIALQAGAADGDYILCKVSPEGILA